MTAAPQVPDPEQPMDGGRARSAGAAHSASPADAGHPAPPVDAGHPVHLVHTAAALRDVPRRAGARAVVMTMGALHEGHATLIRAARRRVGPRGQVVVTVFVNPLQFGAGRTWTAIRAPSTRMSSWPQRPARTRSSPRPSTRSTPAENRRSGSPRAPWAPSWRAPAARATSTAY